MQSDIRAKTPATITVIGDFENAQITGMPIAHENLRFVLEDKCATLRGLFTVGPDGEMQERPLKGFPRDFISATDLNVYGKSASLLQLAFRHQPVEGETYDYRIFVDTDEGVQ